MKETRQRILHAARDNKDWLRVATMNGVSASTARPHKAESLNITADISEDRLEYAKYRFGSPKSDNVGDFVRELLREVEKRTLLFDVVLVYDNASVHNSMKEVIKEAEFVGVQAILLSPYSPMLNPIENAFSVFKSAVKTSLAEHRDEILTVPRGTTKTAHRASWLVRAAEYSLPAKVTPEFCKNWVRHTRVFHYPALNMEDVQVGA